MTRPFIDHRTAAYRQQTPSNVLTIEFGVTHRPGKRAYYGETPEMLHFVLYVRRCFSGLDVKSGCSLLFLSFSSAVISLFVTNVIPDRKSYPSALYSSYILLGLVLVCSCFSHWDHNMYIIHCITIYSCVSSRNSTDHILPITITFTGFHLQMVLLNAAKTKVCGTYTISLAFPLERLVPSGSTPVRAFHCSRVPRLGSTDMPDWQYSD